MEEQPEMTIAERLLVERGYSINLPVFEPLRKWNHIFFQLRHARSQLKILGDLTATELSVAESVDNYLTLARFESAIISYGRCFVGNKSGAKKLHEPAVFNAASDLRPVHQRMMTIRHKLVAHTDGSDLVSISVATRENPTDIEIQHLITSILPLNEVPNFLRAIDQAGSYVDVQVRKQVAIIAGKLGKTIASDIIDETD